MNKEVKVYDNLIDAETHKKVFDWGQSVSWYCKLIVEDSSFINEYIPDGPNPLHHHKRMAPTMYRHPISWSTQSLRERNEIVYDLWQKINKLIFNDKASVDGIPESIAGLIGQKNYFKDGKNFFEKYDCPPVAKGFTAYLNARAAVPAGNVEIGDKVGQIHRDTGAGYEGSKKHFTVLFISNLEWKPSWGGEYMYFGDSDEKDTHWKRSYSVGYADQIVGNKPGRIIIYPHDLTHKTLPPNGSASDKSQRIAFRVVVN